MMDRRTAIRNLALVIGSAAILPACTEHNPVAHFKHFDINLDQQTLVADIAETVIPKTATPGAKDLQIDKFIWLMVDDCAKKEDQKSFLKGMDEFVALTKKMYGKSFTDCSKKEKEAILKSFDKNKTYSKDLVGFYQGVHGLTVYGYTESQYFMTKEIVYELIPGRYNSHFTVKNHKAVKNG